MQTPYTLTSLASFETTVRKSRFLALAHPIQSTQEAMAFLTAQTLPDASHHCWAYRLGDVYRFHDDGEPGGTAGRPILQAIDGQQCDRVVVLVIRWFGGIKLGTGGLVRAYGGAAAQCLRLAQKIALVEEVSIACACPFADMALVRSRLPGLDARIVHEQFNTQGALWHLQLPRTQAENFVQAFLQLTRGQGKVQVRQSQAIRDKLQQPEITEQDVQDAISRARQ